MRNEYYSLYVQMQTSNKNEKKAQLAFSLHFRFKKVKCENEFVNSEMHTISLGWNFSAKLLLSASN